MLSRSTILLLICAVLINGTIWLTVNKPYNLVDSSYPVNSLSFNPFKKHQSPFDRLYLTSDDLESDLKILNGKTRTVRLYSSTRGLEVLPVIAKRHKLNVIVSAYLDRLNTDNWNDQEVEEAIKIAKENKNVTRVIIGNETQLHKIIPAENLIAYLKVARKKLRTPVSTAEPWDFWILNPDFVKEVDYIAIHILPYWNEIPIEKAVDYVFEKYQAVKNTFPKKEIMIAETGWPSDGPQKGAAQASQANQAQFIRDFIQRAEELKINYNIIEAFDQPWKSATEGRVGEHWGILNADRQEKFPLKGPVLEDPNWKYWAFSSTVLGLLAVSLFFFRRRDLKISGQIFSILVFQLAAAGATQMAREASNQYMSPGDIAFWTAMITAQVLLAIIFLTDAVEIADVVGNKPLKRKYLPIAADSESYPFTSVHLACCKEPPDMVIATINSLALLDYPNFEVIVVDNNTPDPALWQPVEARCKELGERFKFFTLGSYPGFKAGALNFALTQTDPRAEVVGVVDADYVVSPNWLKASVPYFLDPKIGIVQAPQEHRQWDHSVFHRMANDEYSGFFRIGMVQRNEHNAIIQHGTMTLISRKILNDLGGWAEWCICEDSELGLRVLNEGKHAIYLDHPFGHGLVPDTYEAYSKQRFRWAYGAMRILRGHWKKIFGLEGNLTFAQRYQFVKGWLPWMGDSLHLLFTITALIWSALLILRPLETDFPEPIFIYPALALVTLRICGTLWTYMARVKIGKRRTILAMIAGGSLTHKIAKAVFQGLFFNSQPFYRTPKMEKAAPLLRNLATVREEFLLAMLLWGGAIGTLMIFGTVNNQAVIWTVALFVQSFPYIAAIVASIVSSGFNRLKA